LHGFSLLILIFVAEHVGSLNSPDCHEFCLSTSLFTSIMAEKFPQTRNCRKDLQRLHHLILWIHAALEEA
jgi:hypothetical protein